MGRSKKTGGTKRAKTSVSSSFDASRFVSADAEARYHEKFKGRHFNGERQICLEMREDNPIMMTIRRRKWEVLVTYAEHASSEIAKEFCANADPENVEQTRVSWVRGVPVSFSAEAIQNFLQTSYNHAAGYCEYADLYNRMLPTAGRLLYREEMPVLAERIRTGITTPYSKWKKKFGNVPERLFMKDLTGECRFWHQFVNSNIMPSSNLTDVNMERAPLLYILTGSERLDIAAVLSDRICQMIKVGRSDRIFGHASLISRLCVQAGLEIPDDEELDVAPDALMTFQTYVNICAKSDQELLVKTGTIGVNTPPSPRVPRILAPPLAPVAPSASSSRLSIPPHDLVYEDSPSYLRMQAQMEFMSIHHSYQTRILESLARAGGLEYASFQPQYPVVPPAPYSTVHHDAEPSHVAESEDDEED